MRRCKIVCRHLSDFCWKTKLVENYPEIQIFAYPVKGSIGDYPTVYKIIFVLQVLESNYKKEFDKVVETCIDDTLPSSKKEFEKKKRLRAKNSAKQKLSLSIYTLRVVHNDKEGSKAFSLLYALRNDGNINMDEEIKWVHVEHVNEVALETVFPRYSSPSIYKENVENLKSIRFDKEAPFKIEFPVDDNEYQRDYLKSYARYEDPLGNIVPARVEREIRNDLENKTIREREIMETLREAKVEPKNIIELLKLFYI